MTAFAFPAWQKLFQPKKETGLPGLSEVDRWRGFAAMGDERIVQVLRAYRELFKEKGFKEKDEQKRQEYVHQFDLLDTFLKRIDMADEKLKTLMAEKTMTPRVERRSSTNYPQGII